MLIETAVGDCSSVLNIADTGRHNNGVNICQSRGEGNSIRMTTIDEEVKKRKIKVGFIKADLEGYGFRMIISYGYIKDSKACVISRDLP
ncbi:MAG: hypothetical protein LBC04_01685 [Holosporaceae bacterium]|nr:hypothetical protein [Holosporaceae bacterium]